MLAEHFRTFFEANPGLLHFAAHSHHPWPDATQAAHERYWRDAATLADRKWERIFSEVVPRAQDHVAHLTGLSDARQVAFAPNTHEFVNRLFSCLPRDRPARVLASAHEFHSFRRQARRLREAGAIDLQEVPEQPWDTFSQRFAAAARAGPWDLVWVSHVLFDSGLVVDVDAVSASAPAGALLVVDGYHAFCAIPVDLRNVHTRAFYLGGGYKYAMSGEGCCFLAVPPGCTLRPVDTGWYAAFHALSDPPQVSVAYSEDGFRFWGATFDPSGLYRFGAAMDWLASTGTDIGAVHRHATRLQSRFLGKLDALRLRALGSRHLVPPHGLERGNFLAFEVDDAEAVQKRIVEAGVYIDRRDRRLRFGFGVYHDDAQVSRLVEALSRALR